jgi:predicted dehydrogenase
MTRRDALVASIATQIASAQQTAPPAVGIIGCGNRSKAHLAALKGLPEAQIAAISDVQPDKMAAFNQGLAQPAATYVDYRELIRDRRVGIVVVATPGYLHKQMALEVMRAGKDLLLEKPIALNYPDALEIVREAKRTKRIVAVGMQRRYARQDTAVRQAVERGDIGSIRLITFSELRGDWFAGSWKYTDPATGKSTNWRNLSKTAGSTELEFSVHAFAEVTSLVHSPFGRLYGSGGVVHYQDGRDTRDLTSFLAEFGNGVRFSYSFTCFAPGSGSSLTIVGDKGVLTRNQGRIMVQLAGRRAEPLSFDAAGPDQPEVEMYREFFRNVRDRTPSPIGPETALEAAKIAYAADMSISGQRVVTASDFPPDRNG